MSLVVVVPLRSFTGPKTRLSDVLDPADRSRLTRELADGVLDALSGWPVIVVSDDHEIEVWARERGAVVVMPEMPGLDAAADAGRRHAADTGHDQLAVVHADLANPTGLGAFLDGATERPNSVVAVTDRRRDGTNVLVVPTAAEFRFAYGLGSFDRHRDEADRLDLEFVAVDHDELCDDVDTPDDLARYRGATGGLPHDA